MSTLHDQLAELADDAPVGGLAPGLWERGLTYRRQRRTRTAALVLAALVLAVALGVVWQRPAPTTVRPADSAPGLPDRIYSPSPWLPGTDDDGPLGVLAAVQAAERRGWLGSSDGVVGISAETGVYRFLDLPDLVSYTTVALAPDGRHVAYWYTGETRLLPNKSDGAVGVAVYDTVTEKVVRHEFPSDHGLAEGDLVWADSERLALTFHRWVTGSGSEDGSGGAANDASGLLVWSPADGVPAPVAGAADVFDIEDSTGTGQLLVDRGPRLYLDLDDPTATTRMPGRPMGRWTSAVDQGGTKVAWPRGDRNPSTIAVQRVDEPEPRVVPDSRRTFSVLAWLDDDHVAAVRRIGGIGPSGLFRVDVRTGRSTLILRFPENTYGTTTKLATDLLASSTVEAAPPPRPLDPRFLTVAVAGFGVFALAALAMWRRRVRA